MFRGNFEPLKRKQVHFLCFGIKTVLFILPELLNLLGLAASLRLQVGFIHCSSSCVQQMLNYRVVSLWLWQANNSVSLSSAAPQRS